MDVKKEDVVVFWHLGYRLRGKIASVLKTQAVIEVTDIIHKPPAAAWVIVEGEVVAVHLDKLADIPETVTEFQAFVAMLIRSREPHRVRPYTTDSEDVVYIRIGSQWQAGFVFARAGGELKHIEHRIDKGEL